MAVSAGGTPRALRYAKALSDNVRAVCVITSPGMRERIQRRWERFPEVTRDITLVAIDYEYRDILRPLVDYIVHVNQVEFPDDLTIVVVPEYVPRRFWARALHNQTANVLRSRLKVQEKVIFVDVPYHIHE